MNQGSTKSFHRVFVSSPDYQEDASFTIVRRRVERCLENKVQLVQHSAQADLHIHIGTPDSLPVVIPSTKLVAYTFAEATRVPVSWVNALKPCDAIWAASTFTIEALTNSGVQAPITWVPLGIECPESPHPRPRNHDDPFTFMWQGTRASRFLDGVEHDGDRKRGYLVEQAFKQLGNPNTRLIIKSLPVENRQYDVRHGSIWRICRSLSKDDLNALDAQVDAFIWPTMGEGFGLPPLEKLALGIPAFPTYWSGPVDYMKDFPLDRLKPSKLKSVQFNGIPAEMAEIELNELVQFMNRCYERRSELANLKNKIHAIAKQKWDYRSQMANKLMDEINQLLPCDTPS